MIPVLVAAVALVALPSVSASAQSTGEYTLSHRSRAALDVGLYHRSSGSTDLTILTPDLRASFDAFDLGDDTSVAIDAALHTMGVVTHLTVAGSTTEASEYRVADLYLGARLGFLPVEGLRVRAGVGVVAPILNAYDDTDVAGGMATWSMFTTGAWDAWLSSRDFLPFVLRGDAEYRDELYFVGGEAGLGLFAPVRDGVDDSAVSAQIAAFGGVRLIPELAFGARLQAVVMASTASGSDPIGYVSLVPFVRGEFDPFFVEGRFFISLADNDNYRFLGEKMWSLNFQFGADFDLY